MDAIKTIPLESNARLSKHDSVEAKPISASTLSNSESFAPQCNSYSDLLSVFFWVLIRVGLVLSSACHLPHMHPVSWYCSFCICSPLLYGAASSNGHTVLAKGGGCWHWAIQFIRFYNLTAHHRAPSNCFALFILYAKSKTFIPFTLIGNAGFFY